VFSSFSQVHPPVCFARATDHAEHTRGGDPHHAPCAEPLKFRLQKAAKNMKPAVFWTTGEGDPMILGRHLMPSSQQASKHGVNKSW